MFLGNQVYSDLCLSILYLEHVKITIIAANTTLSLSQAAFLWHQYRSRRCQWEEANSGHWDAALGLVTANRKHPPNFVTYVQIKKTWRWSDFRLYRYGSAPIPTLAYFLKLLHASQLKKFRRVYYEDIVILFVWAQFFWVEAKRSR